jgi:hypothetical protein
VNFLESERRERRVGGSGRQYILRAKGRKIIGSEVPALPFSKGRLETRQGVKK